MCTFDQCAERSRRAVLREGLAVAVAGMAAGPALAATGAAGQEVAFAGPAGEVKGYLALPAGAGRHPAVLLLHGEIGLPESHRATADEIAAAGFVALAIARFTRIPGFGWEAIRADNEGPRHYLSEAFFREEQQDAIGAIAWLRAHQRVAGKRMGAVGFCGGGIHAIRLSVAAPEIAAVVGFYPPPRLPAQYRNQTDPIIDLVALGSQVRTPVQIHYGTDDYAVQAADVETFAGQVRAAGTPIEVFAYPGARHGFYDRTLEDYDPDRAAVARGRYLNFLRRLGT